MTAFITGFSCPGLLIVPMVIVIVLMAQPKTRRLGVRLATAGVAVIACMLVISVAYNIFVTLVTVRPTPPTIVQTYAPGVAVPASQPATAPIVATTANHAAWATIALRGLGGLAILAAAYVVLKALRRAASRPPE